MEKFNIKREENLDYGGKEILINTGNNYTKECNIFIKIIIGAIIGFVHGFWGGGGGMSCVPLLAYLIKLPEKNAHATTLLIMLPLSIASLVIYFMNGSIEWDNALKISSGFVIGGALGAMILKKISNIWLSIIFSIIILAGGIKLLI